MAGHDLEALGGDTPAHWSKLYRSLGDEVVAHRPIFTGDVFLDSVIGLPEGGVITIDSIILQHPCALRTDGVHLNPRILVAEVRDYKFVANSQWLGLYKRMPLPDLNTTGPGAEPQHRAALFEELHLASPQRLGRRVASLSQFGVNLLLQRWVHHNTRVVVPTFTYQEQTGGVFEEAELVEDWCSEMDGVVNSEQATRDAVAWMRQPVAEGGPMRQVLLVDPQQRNQVRKDMRTHLRAVLEVPANGAPVPAAQGPTHVQPIESFPT